MVKIYNFYNFLVQVTEKKQGELHILQPSYICYSYRRLRKLIS